jgi:hypothetical protein
MAVRALWPLEGPGNPQAARHVSESVSFEYGGDFTCYLGWLIPWGAPSALTGDTPGQVAAAQHDLARIGIGRRASAGTGSPAEWAGWQRRPSRSRGSLTWRPGMRSRAAWPASCNLRLAYTP